MTKSLLADGFRHHVWATLCLIDACMALPPEKLGFALPGTFGPILETVRHIVGSDASYLALLTSGQVPEIEEEQLSLPELRDVMEHNGPVWQSLVAKGDLDPDAVVTRHRPDGSDSYAPLGIRLAEALQHGNDHRSQICTALTTLGVEPPEIDVWALAREEGTLTQTEPANQAGEGPEGSA